MLEGRERLKQEVVQAAIIHECLLSYIAGKERRCHAC